MDPRLPYIVPFAVAALGILAVAVIVLQHRRVRGGSVLFFLCLSAALWSITEGLLYFGFSKELHIIITKLQYLGIATLPPLALMMVFVTFGLTSATTRIVCYALFAMAGLIVIEVWLNGLHQLHFSSYYTIKTQSFPMLGVVHGPLWYAVIAYHYLILLVATIIIIRGLRSPVPIYRGQAQVLLVSILVVWIANGIYVAGLSPVPNMDTGPIAFAVVAASFAWGSVRFKLFDIVPAAKEEIFSSLQNPVIILDESGRIVELNRSAANLFGAKAVAMIGSSLENAMPSLRSLEATAAEDASTEVEIGPAQGEMYFEARINSLKNRKGRRIGTLIVMHDITRRKRLENELKQMASTDSLTGVSNRRHLFELADREHYRARRYGYGLCAVMIDIDRFKALNDSYGHDVGDEALRRLAETCKSEVRTGDIFGRIGGEEFVAVYTNQSLKQALLAAERLREEIGSISIPVPGGKTSMTASLGVAALSKEDSSFDDLLRRADAALYEAKKNGRNCVCAAE